MSGSAITHPAFRSIVSTVHNAEDVEEQIGEALIYQHMFEKRTSPWEMQNWDYEELQQFVLKLKRVDRLYYINHFDDTVSSRTFEILLRMTYKKEKIFVHLSAGCGFTGFDSQGDGEIYITKSANIFLKSIVEASHDPLSIYNSLVEDGYKVEEPTQFDSAPQRLWNNAPMLKFLTHQSVHDNREDLSHYPEVLPTLLSDSVTDFIQVQETRYHHNC
ncbi:unnamed protein product [Meganyctiphanes norvegica]|uniref:Uncharacterized protein n=1 Tax=Meganyctiphanes norvegica TaxID=48144 RepID=A0AAV2SP52_MEGNR